MVEPAELLVIKDQYEQAYRSLSRGLSAEESQNKEEALGYYKQGRRHLIQGMDVPTAREGQQGAFWEKARGLQQRMRDTLKVVDAHLSELENSKATKGEQRSLLLKNLPPELSNTQHLYPTLPAVTPFPKTPPARPPPPTAALTHSVHAEPQGNTTSTNPMDQPPAYTPQPSEGHRSLGHSPTGGQLRGGRTTGGDGDELLRIPSGVQLFFVAPNGQVSSLCRPGFLCIIALDDQKTEKTAERSTVFLNVCDWLFPLTADTPVLLANSGIFMFPDTLSEVPGSYAGIVLSSELPSAERQMFRELLSQLAELRIQDPADTTTDLVNLATRIPLGPPTKQTALSAPSGESDKPLLPGWSEKMGQGILSGATWLGLNLVKGAEATGKAINKSAVKIRDRITPEETPSEVSPHVTRSLHVAKTATDGALRVSRFLVNGVSTVAERVADKVAPHVKKQGAKLIPESLKKKEEGKPSKLDGAKFVAASSFQGISSVWSSLESGAKLVCQSVASETVTTVTYKYGDDAGQATDTALHSVANVGLTAYNFDDLGFKAILKTVCKKGAKAIFKSSDKQAGNTEKTEVQTQESETVQKDAEKQEPLAKMGRKDFN